MLHKVLVLCQRRSSEKDDLSLVNQNINNIATQLLGDDIEIKYLTEDPEGTSDYVGVFDDNDWTRETFMGQKFSLIICNTCPFIIMNYKIINEYLKDEGFLVLSAFQIDGSIGSVKNILRPSLLEAITSEGFNPLTLIKSEGFNLKGIINKDTVVAVVFQKNTKEGGKINKKYKRSRRSRSRKSRRSRRNKKSRRSYK